MLHDVRSDLHLYLWCVLVVLVQERKDRLMNNMARLVHYKVRQDEAYSLVRMARTEKDKTVAVQAFINARVQMVYHAPVFKDLIINK